MAGNPKDKAFEVENGRSLRGLGNWVSADYDSGRKGNRPPTQFSDATTDRNDSDRCQNHFFPLDFGFSRTVLPTSRMVWKGGCLVITGRGAAANRRQERKGEKEKEITEEGGTTRWPLTRTRWREGVAARDDSMWTPLLLCPDSLLGLVRIFTFGLARDLRNAPAMHSTDSELNVLLLLIIILLILLFREFLASCIDIGHLTFRKEY